MIGTETSTESRLAFRRWWQMKKGQTGKTQIGGLCVLVELQEQPGSSIFIIAHRVRRVYGISWLWRRQVSYLYRQKVSVGSSLRLQSLGRRKLSMICSVLAVNIHTQTRRRLYHSNVSEALWSHSRANVHQYTFSQDFIHTTQMDFSIVWVEILCIHFTTYV